MKIWGSCIRALLISIAFLTPGLCPADAVSDAAYAEAIRIYGTGDYNAALVKAEEAARIDPRNWQAWQLAGNCRIGLNDQANAIIEYDYALSINPDNPQLKDYVAQLKGSGQPAPAGAAQADHYTLATQAYNSANYDQALLECAAAIKENPRHWEAWQVMGNARYARSDKRGALDAYRKSLEINPANSGLKGFADTLETEVKNAPPPDNSAIAPATTPVSRQAATAEPREKNTAAKPGFDLFIGLNGGTAMVNLSPFVGKAREYIYADVESSGLTPVITEKAPKSYIIFGVDGVAKRKWYGLTAAIYTTLMKDLTVSSRTEDAWGNSRTEDWKVGVGWLEGTVGVFGQVELMGMFYGRGGVKVGLGLADVRLENTIKTTYPPSAPDIYTAEMESRGWMIPFGAEVEGGIHLMEKFEIFIKGGWEKRYAPVLISDKPYDKNGDGVIDSEESVTKALVDVHKKPWPIDLSGAYVQFGARMARF